MDQPSKPQDDSPDMPFLKDMIDIIKNKLLFFMPFFGAFFAFLLTKHDYVSNANWLIKILCLITLVVGLWYAYQVVQAFWILDHLRLIHTFDKMGGGRFIQALSDKEKDAYKAALSKITIIHGAEDRYFRRAMYMLYWTGGAVLFDIYFGATLNSWLLRLSERVAQ